MRTLILASPLTLLSLSATMLPGCATEGQLEEFASSMDDDLDGHGDAVDCEPDNDEVHDHEWYVDADGDGHGDPDSRVDTCDKPDDGKTWVSVGDDCNDADPAVYQTSTGYRDGDQDGYGSSWMPVTLCDDGDTLADRTGDCDDADEAVNPDMSPVCGNAKDDDCDGRSDCEALGDEMEAEDAPVRYLGDREEALGASLTVPGDVDGDGFEDLVVGAPDEEGVAYLLRGPFEGQEDVDRVAAAQLQGPNEDGAAGSALVGLGDLDGDGYDDFMAGAPGGSSSMVVVVFGPMRFVDEEGDGAVLGTDSLDMLELTLSGDGEELGVGTSLGAPGDLLGSGGEADVVVGVPGGSAVYVVQGPLNNSVVMDEGDGVSTIGGGASLDLGQAVATLQDLDGDGRTELAVGAPGFQDDSSWSMFRPAVGAVYVFFEAGDLRVSDADVVFVGEEGNAGFGSVLADAGDVDGDGLGDLMLGAPDNDDQRGAAWVFTGAQLLETSALELDDAQSYLYGADTWEWAGTSALGGHDIDGDGAQDLLVGSPGAEWGGGSYADPVGGVGVWYGPVSGRHNAQNADVLFLGDEELDGALFGWSLDLSDAGDLFIGAPGVGAEREGEGGDVLFGDGATYAFHLGW